MKLIASIFFICLGIAALLELRFPYEKRTARWGRHGEGVTMSAISIVIVSAWLFSLAALFIAQLSDLHVRPDLDVIIVASGFGAAVIAGLVDTVIDGKNKKVLNQSTQPPRPTGG